jgi:hypothetical protein
VAEAGNIIRSTVAAPRIPTGLRPIDSAARREAIPWRIAKQMPDSGNKVGLAIALQAGLAIGAESATAGELGTVVALEITVVALEIIVAEPETEEGTVQVLGRVTGARIVEKAGEIVSETAAFPLGKDLVVRVLSAEAEGLAEAAPAAAAHAALRAWADREAVAREAAVVDAVDRPISHGSEIIYDFHTA